jgi:hypothetical protein
MVKFSPVFSKWLLDNYITAEEGVSSRLYACTDILDCINRHYKVKTMPRVKLASAKEVIQEYLDSHDDETMERVLDMLTE